MYEIKLPEDHSEVPKLLQIRLVNQNLLANKMQKKILTWKEIVPNKVINMLRNSIILPLIRKSFINYHFKTSFL